MTNTIGFIADDLVNVDVSHAQEAQNLAEALRRLETWEDVIPAGLSVVAQFNPLKVSYANVEEIIRSVLAQEIKPLILKTEILNVPVRYGGQDGPDFIDVCKALSLSKEQFIQRHTQEPFVVEMIGFLPGFSYVKTDFVSSAVSRLATPRVRVAQGSIGMISGYTGIYPVAGPGGWPIIGRTEKFFFDPTARNPFLITAGTRIKFEAV